MVHDPSNFLDRLPEFPEVVSIGVPRGFGAKLKDRARQEGLSRSALLRRALEKLLAEAPTSPKAA